MISPETERQHEHDSMLRRQLRWFITLRWIAAGVALLGAAFEHRFGWFGGIAGPLLAVGAAMLLYNAMLAFLLPRVRVRRLLLALALWQILMDLIVLTALVTWTGGMHSPLATFFVFHMVFASLLLSESLALTTAMTACILVACGLALGHKFPHARDDLLGAAGLLLTFVLTVILANRITRDLRAHRRRLLRQNRRVKAMSDQLRRQQQALVQHEKMIAMGQMAAGVTHEITNPLASIDSLLQLAQRHPERLKPHTLQTLREQVQRINQIIRQMKTFAHPAEMAAQAQALPLNAVVEQSLDMIRFDRRMKNVEIRREYDPGAGSILLWPQAIEQVLVNLIVNALDAMAQSQSRVLSIRTRRREGWCVIEISDTGQGIDPQHMPRLFEPFFTTKPVGQGTGLGLSISYSLMQKQGGSISVRSQPGRGATFILRLPTEGGGEPSRKREAAISPVAVPENPSL
jgi:signal transduction histidine kinase